MLSTVKLWIVSGNVDSDKPRTSPKRTLGAPKQYVLPNTGVMAWSCTLGASMLKSSTDGGTADGILGAAVGVAVGCALTHVPHVAGQDTEVVPLHPSTPTATAHTGSSGMPSHVGTDGAAVGASVQKRHALGHTSATRGRHVMFAAADAQLSFSGG